MSEEPPDDPGFLDEDEVQRCGVPKTSDGDPCRHPVPNGTCPVHGDREDRRQTIDGETDPKVPDGLGSGDPGHTKGGGAPPEGNKNAMSHGVHAVKDDPTGTLAWLKEHEQDGYDWVITKWKSYLADAPFGAETAKADDLLEVCLMKYAVRQVRKEQVQTRLTKMLDIPSDNAVDGVVEVEDELPANLPANRMAREARSILKDLGILDDPESQKADAMADWGSAAKRVAERRDGDVDA